MNARSGGSAESSREVRLEAARRVDWRFLLHEPRLTRVACVVPGDERLPLALAELGVDVATGGLTELAAMGGRWQVVVVDRGRAKAPEQSLAAAVGLVQPGGWLLIHAPPRARLSGDLRLTERALRSSDVESIRRHWHLPSRAAATRVVPLDDPVAVRVALGRHASTRRRNFQAAAARAIAAHAPADLLGGDVTLVARRAGGPSIGPWPGLGPLGTQLAAETRLNRPSFVMLTPRFRASAHVILLVIDEDGRTRLVAKVARLPEDGRILELEAEHLRALAGSAIERGSVPEVLTIDRVGGHAVLVESALDGQPLDRAMVRRDPGRWIGAVSSWLERMPVDGSNAGRTVGGLLDDALDRIRAVEPHQGDGLPDLVSRARDLLHAIRNQPLPRVFEHGDFGHPNILARDGDRLGVLDWETATRDGMPLHDLCFFMGYVALSITATDGEPFDGFMRVLEHPEWGAVRAVRADARRLGIEPRILPALALSCWTRALARVLDRLEVGREVAAAPGWVSRDRYYALWVGAVRHHEQIAQLLS